MCLLNILSVGGLVGDMITHKHGYSSLTLLESATVIWTVNVFLFAIMFWQAARPVDFRFAEAADAAEAGSAWEPRFVDFLFLAFVASTSFAPPDYARPASHRAKFALIVQAAISLVTLFLIASRAIATLS